MEKFTVPFEVKYQNKTAILTVSKNIVECMIGNNITFSIPTKSIRIVDVPKKQQLLLNWQKNKEVLSI